MIKNHFLSALLGFLYCIGLLIPTFSVAADRDVAAHVFYTPYGRDSPQWESADQAVSYFQGLYPNGSNFRVVAHPSDTKTLNGKGAYYIEYDYTPPGGVLETGSGSTSLTYECPYGTSNRMQGTFPTYFASCVIDPVRAQPPCDTCPTPTGPKETVGNPIFPATLMKIETAVDYVGGGANSLQFVRTYRSDQSGWTHNFMFTGVDYTSPATAAASAEGACFVGVGAIARRRLCSPFLPRGTANDFSVRRGHGRMLTFGTAADLKPMFADVTDKVAKVLNSQGQAVGWQVFNAKNNSTELYGLNGLVSTITQPDGRSRLFTYSTVETAQAIAPRPGLLLSVTDNFGYRLSFTYDTQGRMKTMTAPDGETTVYAYDEPSAIIVAGGFPVGNLTSVTYPGGKKRVYWYNEQDKTENTDLPAALTGISDENGIRFSSYRYNRKGQAISTEHAGGVQKYGVEPWTSSTSYVTDPLGNRNRYEFATVSDVARMKSVEQKPGAGSPATTITNAFDNQGNITSTKDASGSLTTFVYDLIRNLETSRTEAVGKPEARTVKTEWHPTLNIVKRVSEPLLRTTMEFDANGNVLSRTIQATTDANGSQGFNAALTGKSRTWTYTYNSVGQVLTEAGPRTDVVVKTTYTYDAAGNIKTVTNPAGHVTTFDSYDANGRPTMITGPNGQITRFSYLPRGWLQSTSVTDAGSSLVQTTSYTYDDVGQMLSVTMPDQTATYYTYDAAHRLTDVQDSLGNKIHYTLDNMGKRIEEKVTDPSGTLARQISRQYDVLSRLKSQTGGL